MKSIKKILVIISLVFSVILFASCNEETQIIKITNGDNQIISVGEELKLNVVLSPSVEGEVTFASTNLCASVSSEGVVRGISEGKAMIIASIGDHGYSINIEVRKEKVKSIIISSDKLIIKEGEELELSSSVSPVTREEDIEYSFSSGGEFASLSGNKVTAIRKGTIKIIATIDDVISNILTIEIVDKDVVVNSITISANKNEIIIDEDATLYAVVDPVEFEDVVVYEITEGKENARIVQNTITALEKGTIKVVGKIKDVVSNTLEITITDLTKDPYENMSANEFYLHYEEAKSYKDSYYRSLHNFMSGSIEEQDQHPTISPVQPKEDGLFIRNSRSYYSDDGNTYSIVDYTGTVVDKVYKGGAYVVLEEVAAYVFAFGDVPVNYTESKSTSPNSSPWKEYLRLNHTFFSGDVESYPYEPILPNLYGAGGNLFYYEIDVGTTGTDCDPRYDTFIYNNGSRITRGAARIVYTRHDNLFEEITDINDKYLFYTYNHYNDFQEYLNYLGGWGEMFGNITGGGEISSYTNYNPTPYIKVILKNL